MPCRVNIGGVAIEGYACLAPMAGVADAAFRSICREMGACLSVSEMVSAKALVYNRKDTKTHSLLIPYANEKPYAVQIFGSEPDIMAEGAKIVEDFAHPDLIDINMGCPVTKVSSNGEGSALMRDPRLAGAIVEACVRSAECPVTVKMRLGWDESSINAPELARICEESGASAITVHGRTRSMFYSGSARYEEIAEIKSRSSIPIIANGDIMSGESANAVFNSTGANLVMVGRGALGNPWVFQRINAFFANKRFTPPDKYAIIAVLKEQAVRAIALKGEDRAMKELRPHAMWYVRGMRNASRLKEYASHISAYDDLAAFCELLLTIS